LSSICVVFCRCFYELCVSFLMFITLCAAFWRNKMMMTMMMMMMMIDQERTTI